MVRLRPASPRRFFWLDRQTRLTTRDMKKGRKRLAGACGRCATNAVAILIISIRLQRSEVYVKCDVEHVKFLRKANL